MKKIIPHKLVITYAPDGTVKSSILQYRIDVDGATENKFYTMSVKTAIDKTIIEGVLAVSKECVEIGEKIVTEEIMK